MYKKEDSYGFLIFLISCLIISDLLMFFYISGSFFQGKSWALISIFSILLLTLSLVISLHDSHPKRFLYIFWNPILAGIIGTSSLYSLISNSDSFSWIQILQTIMVFYSILAIYYTDILARKFREK